MIKKVRDRPRITRKANLRLHVNQAEAEQEQASQGVDSKQLASAIQHPTRDNLSANTVMQLQRRYGNRFVNSLVQRQTVSKTPASIQRLTTDESYYYHATESDSVNVKDLRDTQAFKKLVSNIRMYHLLSQNQFMRTNLSTMLSKLDVIYRAAELFDGEAFKVARKAERLLDPTDIRYKDMIGTLKIAEVAMDDVNQEREAIKTIQKTEAFRDGELTWKDALFLARMGETPDTILTEGDLAGGNGTNDAGNPENLTGGAVSEVTALDYQESEGGSKRRVFKPNEEKAQTPLETVKSSNVQSTYRAMAISRVNEMIKTKMNEAGREFQSLVGDFDVAQYGGKIGSVGDFAEGKEAVRNVDKDGERKEYALNIDISDIAIQQQLANLQLFDILTGQIDRHQGNIFIQKGKGKESKVTGIDNDFSFATDTSIRSLGPTTLPEKIDLYFAQMILAITPNELLDQLKGLGQQEKDAAVTRLKALHELLENKLAANELLVAPGDTNYPDAPSWGDVDIDSYRSAENLSGIRDYAGQIKAKRDKAYQAVVQNPAIEPEQDEKGNWVLEYDTDFYLKASEENGSDLFELVEAARADSLEKSALQYGSGSHSGRRRRNQGIGMGVSRN